MMYQQCLHFFGIVDTRYLILPLHPPPATWFVHFFLQLSDEFDGETLDTTKWTADPKVSGWPGRQPGLFDSNNVVVSNGTLQLWARKASRSKSWPAVSPVQYHVMVPSLVTPGIHCTRDLDNAKVLFPRCIGSFKPSTFAVSEQIWNTCNTLTNTYIFLLYYILIYICTYIIKGYDNYTTSMVHSLAKVKEGYFEIRWRSGTSGISSSWWFHDNDGSTWTEIDVFETTGTDNPPPGRCAGIESTLMLHATDLLLTSRVRVLSIIVCNDSLLGPSIHTVYCTSGCT